MFRWHILTGEYPPQPGGVSDYTRLVARGLAAAGDEVQVWCPPCGQPLPADPGVLVRRLPDHCGPRSLVALHTGLMREGPQARLLVQYVPHAFGFKAMNLPLCWWLTLRRRLPLWVMFHEVSCPVERGLPWKHRLLGHVTRRMAALVARSARRILVSTPIWESVLRTITPLRCPVTWLPVPSNVPPNVPPTRIAEVRARLRTGPVREVIGHFGTFGALMGERLASILPPLLQGRRERLALLIGQGGERLSCALADRYPELRPQLRATGALPAEEIAPHLASCDVLVQPYPDGVTTRRTSLMAGLALGIPCVTTVGRVSEPLWQSSSAVALAPVGSDQALVSCVETVLADSGLHRSLAERSVRLYQEHFSLERTIAGLRGDDTSRP
jgi:glycosyltransferase involved in cell wall biosynthesis